MHTITSTEYMRILRQKEKKNLLSARERAKNKKCNISGLDSIGSKMRCQIQN